MHVTQTTLVALQSRSISQTYCTLDSGPRRIALLPAHLHGITQYKMASNIRLTSGRDREIAGLILLFR